MLSVIFRKAYCVSFHVHLIVFCLDLSPAQKFDNAITITMIFMTLCYVNWFNKSSPGCAVTQTIKTTFFDVHEYLFDYVCVSSLRRSPPTIIVQAVRFSSGISEKNGQLLWLLVRSPDALVICCVLLFT